MKGFSGLTNDRANAFSCVGAGIAADVISHYTGDGAVAGGKPGTGGSLVLAVDPELLESGVTHD